MAALARHPCARSDTRGRHLAQRASPPETAQSRSQSANRGFDTRQALPCQGLGLSAKGLGVGEFIAIAPHRQDQLRLGWIDFDLFAETLHERVDAAAGDERLLLPHASEQSLTRKDDARI